MKILNFSPTRRFPLNRNEYLVAEIQRLYEDLQPEVRLPAATIDAWPLYIKETHLRMLEDWMESLNLSGRVPEQSTDPLTSTTFHGFMNLPIEIRLIIWDCVSLPTFQPRIHCIRRIKEDFVSNQPMSSLLHICKESRDHYIDRTRSIFGFGTYVNFDTDVIYYAEESPTRKEYENFLQYDDTWEIKNLAMRDSLFCNLPSEGDGHFSKQHWELTTSLPNWKEMTLVFFETYTVDAIWEDEFTEFQDLSARHKRRYHRIGYARKHNRYLNSRLRGDESNDEKPLQFRYVRVIHNKMSVSYFRK